MTALSVLQVVTSTDRRGAETFAVDLGRELASRGLRVETAALAPGLSGGLDLQTLGTTALGAAALNALRKRAHAVDVVIAHGSTTLPACALALVGARTPFIYRNIGDPSYWSRDAFRRWRTAVFLSRAARVAALSDESAQTLHDRYRVDRSRLHVIPTGVSAERFQPVTAAERHAARASLDLKAGASVAAVVGALNTEKAADRAIRSFAASALDVLLLAGEGPDRSHLEALARKIAPGRVRFLGSVDPRPIYAATDLVLLTSRSEGLPAVLIEAGLCGVPAVATDVGYVREVVVDGVTGVVVSTDHPDRLTRALADGLHLPDVARRAREHCIAHFELGTVTARWCQVIEAAVGETR